MPTIADCLRDIANLLDKDDVDWKGIVQKLSSIMNGIIQDNL